MMENFEPKKKRKTRFNVDSMSSGHKLKIFKFCRAKVGHKNEKLSRLTRWEKKREIGKKTK